MKKLSRKFFSIITLALCLTSLLLCGCNKSDADSEKTESAKNDYSAPVEFAVKLPGDGEGSHVYLPIDSKFPLDCYRQLEEAYDQGQPKAIEEAGKLYESGVISGGSLPRKTFSMGHAREKRYYLEGRKIR